MDIRRAADTGDVLGEGPVWCPVEQALYWVDIRQKAVRRLNGADGRTESWTLPEMVGSLAVRRDGGLLLALASSLGTFDPGTGELVRLTAPAGADPAIRYNDGKCDRQGRFWAGTMNDRERRPDGVLYRYDPVRGSVPMLSGITIPNSLCWSPDDRTMYFADSFQATIFAFPFTPETGELGERRIFARVELPGVPDGATVDAEGHLWCAQYGAWRLTRYAPDGSIDRELPLPVQQPTSCAFGGPDLATLFITTASQRLTPEQRAEQPLAGALLACEPGVPGLPEPRFAG